MSYGEIDYTGSGIRNGIPTIPEMYDEREYDMKQYVHEITRAERHERWPHIDLSAFSAIRKDALERMRLDAMNTLESMVADAKSLYGWKFVVNSGFRDGDTGQHGKGCAIDGVFIGSDGEPVPLIQQYCFALLYPWGGVGIYPHWIKPGIHVDNRPREPRVATWCLSADGEYENVIHYLKGVVAS